MKTDQKNTNFGKPWTPAGSFSSYEEANTKREKLLENNKVMQVKVRRRYAEKCFTVHYRNSEVVVPKNDENVSKTPRKVKSKRQKRADKRGQK